MSRERKNEIYKEKKRTLLIKIFSFAYIEEENSIDFSISQYNENQNLEQYDPGDNVVTRQCTTIWLV